MELITYIIITLLSVVVLWGFFSSLAFLLVKLLKRRWGVDVRVGSVGLGSFGRLQAKLPHNITIEVEKLWLSSSYVSKQVCKPFTVCSTGVRVQLDLSGVSGDPPTDPDEETEGTRDTSGTENSGTTPAANSQVKKDMVYRLLKRFQLLGLNVDNVVVTIYGPAGHFSVLMNVADVCAYSSTSQENLEVVQVALEVKKFSAKLLTAATDVHMNTCQAELSLSTHAVAELDSNSSVQACNLYVASPSLQLAKGFLSFLHEYRALAPSPSFHSATTTPTSSAPSLSSSASSISSYSSATTLPSTQQPANTSSRITDFIPKEAAMYVERLEIVITRDTATMRNVKLQIRDILVSQTNCRAMNLTILDVYIFSQQANIASVKELKLDGTIDDDVVVVNGNLDHGFLGYHYEEWQYWNHAVFTKLRDMPRSHQHPQQQQQPQRSSPTNVPSISNIVPWWRRRRIKLTVNSQALSVACANAACSGVKAGVQNCSLFVGLNSSTAGLLTERDCKLEVEMSSLYCKTADFAVPSMQLSSKQHHSNTMLFVGILIVKSHLVGQEVHLDCLVDSLQLELASPNIRMLSKLISPFLHGNQDNLHGNLQATPAKTVLTLNAELNNINVYAVAENGACCILRLNLVTAKLSPPSVVTLQLNAIKLCYINKLNAVSDILRCQDIQNHTGFLRSITINGTKKSLQVDIADEMKMTWMCALHMTLHEVITEAASLARMIHSNTSSTLPVPAINTKGKPEEKKRKDITVLLRSRARFTMRLAEDHSVAFQVSRLNVTKQKESVKVTTPSLEIVFDEHDIIKMQELCIEYEPHSSLPTRLERVDLELPSNRTVHVSVTTIKIEFPFNYDFYSCFTNLLSCNKWRKLIYPPKPRSEEKLPPDLLFDIKSISMQLSDDPFEVKLGDNHELLKDEQMENKKRMQAMDKRVQELRKEHGLLPSSKVEFLYGSLKEKSACVYLQRSQALYASSPMRTRLIALTYTNLHISALADTAFHGEENAIRIMREIDKSSPYPEGGIEFSSLWCRQVKVDMGSAAIQLRDYELPMLDIQNCHIWGRLVGAEQKAARKAQLHHTVEIGHPWPAMHIVRNMQPMKFFHDFSSDVSSFIMTYGPCWEPCIAYCNLVMNTVNRPSRDPSQPLVFWDKSRLLFHGRLTMCADKLCMLYHASLDPYNSTELMDCTWTNLLMDWTNAKWVFKGDLDIFAHTASKYDDCRLLHLPNLRFCVLLEWLCKGDPNDHHSVSPVAPDQVTDHSKKHDSYEKFRSVNMNVGISMESVTPPAPATPDHSDSPRSTLSSTTPANPSSCLFYNSTLRWMDKIKMCMARVARPIRRGKLYNIPSYRKPQLTRHHKHINLSVKLQEFEVCYWGSFAKQHGLEMRGKSFSLNLGTQLNIVPIEDGLVHRPRADMRIQQFTCDLGSTTIYLCSTHDGNTSMRAGPIDKSYFLSLEKLSYQRSEELPNLSSISEDKSMSSSINQETLSRHKIQIYNCKASWTLSNRNVGISLYDNVMNAQTLKKNLSSAALKGLKVETSSSSQQQRGGTSQSSSALTASDASTGPTSSVPTTSSSSFNTTVSPMSRLQAGPGYSMLTKLVNESDSKFVAVHEEIGGGNVPLEELHGIAACQTDDVLSRNWHVELINSQVQLRGVETSGYVIVSTGKASILSCDHKPVWRDQQLKSKTTWVGSVESMQYYATVESGGQEVGEQDHKDDEEDTVWLSQDHIQQAADQSLLGLESMIGSSQTVGGVIVTSTKQLQRIISRCKCQFFFASYGELDTNLPLSPSSAAVTDMLTSTEEGVDSFSLLHHDLNICTNSAQYLMILDIVNNLLLHSEPKKKELLEKVQSMRFQLHLMSIADQKTPIQQKQDHLRECILALRKYEKRLWVLHKALDDSEDDTDVLLQIVDVEARIDELKEQISMSADQLAVMVSAYKESQLIAEEEARKLLSSGGEAGSQQEAPVSRRIELCFKHAEWRMTDTDGQIGIADLMMRNFLYTKLNRDDNSGSHQLEMGFIKVTNLQPNTPYKDVLGPQDSHSQGFSERQMMLRVLCKFKAPVGGISIREHFEVNVVPLHLQLTKRLYNAVMTFFFPGKNAETDVDSSDDETDTAASGGERGGSKKRKHGATKTVANSKFFVNDIDKMKERAAKNNMFLYVKIPEVPLRVSYKGLKDKNIIDVHDFTFILPTLEYHNTTWTWLDMLMSMKNDSKKVLISQAIKQKLHLKTRTLALEGAANVSSSQEMQDEHKSQLLFGSKFLGGPEKSSSKKSLFGKAQKGWTQKEKD